MSLTVDKKHLNIGHFQDQFREWVRLCRGSLISGHLQISAPCSNGLWEHHWKALGSPPHFSKGHTTSLQGSEEEEDNQPGSACLAHLSCRDECLSVLTCSRCHWGMASTHLISTSAPTLTPGTPAPCAVGHVEAHDWAHQKYTPLLVFLV